MAHPAVPPVARISQARDQGKDIGVTSLTVVLGSIARALLPTSTTLDSAGQEVLVPKAGDTPTWDTAGGPLKWRLGLPPGTLGSSLQ